MAVQELLAWGAEFHSSQRIARPPYRWVAVPWQFVRFNLLAGASVQYGRHPWHWNFSLGVPTVATTLLPLLVMGLLLSRHDGKRCEASSLRAREWASC